MPDYIFEPLDTDSEVILQDFVDFIQAYFPNWQASDAQLDYIMARYISLKLAMTADMANRVLRSIFMYYGATVIGVIPTDATPATGSATLNIIDNSANHTLAADTFVGIADDNGDIQIFSVLYDVDVLAGATTLQVDLQAVESGAAGNDLAGTVQFIEQVDWISNGTTNAPTSGGTDPEEVETYLNRLTDNLSLMAPRPVLGPDFATISKNIPGVWRAAAIDNYLPGPPPVTNAPNAVAVAAIDQSGNAISPTLKTQLDAYLQSLRQQNFIVNVIDPTYNVCDVTVDFYKVSVASVEEAKAQVEAALKTYLSPATWGIPAYPVQERGWVNSTALRYLELTTIVENCSNCDHISNLVFSSTAGGTKDKNDKTLTGAFPLTNYGTIIGNPL